MIKQQYVYNALITDVYDGDTVTAVIDAGFNITFKTKFRLSAIDTPELRGDEREQGLKVRDYVRARILGKTVIIQTMKDKTGKYGRYLCAIWFYYNGEHICLNDHLLQIGYAKPYEK